MRKLNSVVYHKLLLQAEEAKLQQLTKLATGILSAVGPVAEDEEVQYRYAELEDEIYQGLWKLATHVIKYHDVKSADADKINDRIETLTNRFIHELELSLDVPRHTTGPFDNSK